jgi:hypothetical protein
MKSLALLGLLLLVATRLCVADSSPESICQNVALKIAVTEEQFHYNRYIDDAFTIGFTQGNPPTADFNTSIDMLMSKFCPDNAVWFAYQNGVPVFNATNFAGIKSLYTLFSQVLWRNFSRHMITNPIVTPYTLDHTQYAEFNGSINQLQIKQNPIVWAMSIGWYHNTWRQNHDGSLCMTRFEAWTTSDHTFPGAFGENFVLNAHQLGGW